MAAPHTGTNHGTMEPGTAPRHGYTLLELLIVLTLVGTLATIALPPLTRWRDEAAAHAARDELIGALAWTRVAAIAHGGATLVLDPAIGRFWTELGDGSRRPAIDLKARYRVTVDAGRTDAIHLYYDALGIGRRTSRTLRIRRGAAEAGLTISAYGRARPW